MCFTLHAPLVRILPGDAIHAMMPNLGQGGCQAIEDAMVLAQVLGALEVRGQRPTKNGLVRHRRSRSAFTHNFFS
jgi:zeaxanthin epoxidase